MSGSFIVFLSLTLLSTTFFYFFVKETKGLTHKEVDKIYGKDWDNNLILNNGF